MRTLLARIDVRSLLYSLGCEDLDSLRLSDVDLSNFTAEGKYDGLKDIDFLHIFI